MQLSVFFAVTALAQFVGPLWGAWAVAKHSLNLVAHVSGGVFVFALTVAFFALTRSALDVQLAESAPLVSRAK
jgi:hypothetical protein